MGQVFMFDARGANMAHAKLAEMRGMFTVEEETGTVIIFSGEDELKELVQCIRWVPSPVRGESAGRNQP